MSWITVGRSGRRTRPESDNGPVQTRTEGSRQPKRFNQEPYVSAPQNIRGARARSTDSSSPVVSARCRHNNCGTRNTNASNGIFNQISGSQYFSGVPVHMMINPPAPSPQNRQANRNDRTAGCWPELLAEERRLQEKINTLMRGWDEERRLRKKISDLRTICRSLSPASESWDDEEGSTDGGKKKKNRKRGKSGRRRPY